VLANKSGIDTNFLMGYKRQRRKQIGSWKYCWDTAIWSFPKITTTFCLFQLAIKVRNLPCLASCTTIDVFVFFELLLRFYGTAILPPSLSILDEWIYKELENVFGIADTLWRAVTWIRGVEFNWWRQSSMNQKSSEMRKTSYILKNNIKRKVN